MSRPPSPTIFVAVVVVRDADRYVLVEETRDRGWYLPAGQIEDGEGLLAGAHREVQEEAGIDVEFEGLVRLEHTPSIRGVTRLRVLLLARPRDATRLKSTADGESERAVWVRVDEGGRILPLSALAREGSPL